ncbi:MAG: hypothetical protein M1822_008590 [Bathelium mastoideum]|nr:MAG: hypothetical protein M1822_008590 [Bathelium mastoideum]
MDVNLHTPTRSPQPLQYQDSPFSDYFTDCSMDSLSPIPTFAQKQLIQRLGNLGALVLRKEPSERAYELLYKSLNDMEDALGEIDSQSRQPADVADSGLFLADDDPFTASEALDPSSSPPPSPPPTSSALTRTDSVHEHKPIDLALQTTTTKLTISNNNDNNTNATHDQLLPTAHALLARVTAAATQLRARLAEVQHANDVQTEQLGHAATEIGALRSERAALAREVACDHSELLFLRLQMRALEMRAKVRLGPRRERNTGGNGRDGEDGEGEREGVEWRDWEGDLGRWKRDWRDVVGRVRRRGMGKEGLGEELGEGWMYEQGWEDVVEEEELVTGVQGKARSPMSTDEDGEMSTGNEYLVEASGLDLSGIVDDRPEDDTQVLSNEVDNKGGTVEEEKDEEQKVSSTRTPVQELWDSLMALAGINDY